MEQAFVVRLVSGSRATDLRLGDQDIKFEKNLMAGFGYAVDIVNDWVLVFLFVSLAAALCDAGICLRIEVYGLVIVLEVGSIW